MTSPSTPTPGLRDKVVRGSAWVGAHYGLRQALKLVRLVIVARLVTPADIGLIGMAGLAITLVRVLTETGLHQAVIQRPDESADVLDTTWTTLLIRNTIIAAVLALGAGHIARFFDEPAAEAVVRVVSIVLLLDGLTNVAVILFQKRLDFRLQAFYLGGAEIVEFVFTIVLAFALRDVWALVYGRIIGIVARVALSYAVHPRRPRLHIDRKIFMSLIGYGKWLTASSILVYALVNGDKLVVGRYLGAEALGFYQIAFSVSNLPATAISHVVSSVMFPAYAASQNDIPRLARMYLGSLRVTMLLSVPIAALIGALADVFVPVLLGERWTPAVGIIQILCVYGLTRSLGATTGAVFLAIGKPEIRTHIQTLQLLLFAAVLYPMTKAWGIAGVAAAATTYAIVSNPYAVYRAARECRVAPWGVFEALLIPIVAGAVAVVAVRFALPWLAGMAPLAALVLLAGGGVILYFAVVAVYDTFWKPSNRAWRRDLSSALAAMRRRGTER